mmetsp:Transcript_4554/g.12080  ORF Transcript_4554/g.12080 Transcript_4554/m.12080 type:complete len:865 (+) Transcript_4554:67-2661(+)
MVLAPATRTALLFSALVTRFVSWEATEMSIVFDAAKAAKHGQTTGSWSELARALLWTEEQCSVSEQGPEIDSEFEEADESAPNLLEWSWPLQTSAELLEAQGAVAELQALHSDMEEQVEALTRDLAASERARWLESVVVAVLTAAGYLWRARLRSNGGDRDGRAAEKLQHGRDGAASSKVGRRASTEETLLVEQMATGATGDKNPERLQQEIATATHERQLMQVERDAAIEAKQAAIEAERAAVEAKRAAVEERQAAVEECDVALAEKRAALADKQKAYSEKQEALLEMRAALEQRQLALQDQHRAEASCSAAVEAREEAMRQRDAAIADKVAVIEKHTRVHTELAAEERDAALKSARDASGQRDAALQEARKASTQRDEAVRDARIAAEQCDAAIAERHSVEVKCQAALAEKQAMLEQRNAALAYRQAAVEQCDATLAGKQAAELITEQLAVEKQSLLERLDAAIEKRQAIHRELTLSTSEAKMAVEQREAAVAERNAAVAAQETAEEARDRAQAEREAAVRERSEARAARASALTAMDAAVKEWDRVVAERDHALAERDEALREREEYRELQQEMLRDRAELEEHIRRADEEAARLARTNDVLEARLTHERQQTECASQPPPSPAFMLSHLRSSKQASANVVRCGETVDYDVSLSVLANALADADEDVTAALHVMSPGVLPPKSLVAARARMLEVRSRRAKQAARASACEWTLAAEKAAYKSDRSPAAVRVSSGYSSGEEADPDGFNALALSPLPPQFIPNGTPQSSPHANAPWSAPADIGRSHSLEDALATKTLDVDNPPASPASSSSTSRSSSQLHVPSRLLRKVRSFTNTLRRGSLTPGLQRGAGQAETDEQLAHQQRQ